MLAFGLGSVAVGSLAGRRLSSQLSMNHGAPSTRARVESHAVRFTTSGQLARLSSGRRAQREREEERVFAVGVVGGSLADLFEAEARVEPARGQVAAPHFE